QQAHLGSLSAAGLRARVHATGARDAQPDRAHRRRRIRGAGALGRQPARAGGPARIAGLSRDPHVAVARSARPPAAAGQVPHPLRRADAVRRQPERRGRGDRRQGRAREGAHRRDDRARSRGWPFPVLLRMRLEPRVRPGDPEFRANAEHMARLVTELRAARRRAAEGGPEEARERHTARGKLLARERVEQLLDPGTPFLELAPLAATGCYEDDAPGAGMITGIGTIAGQQAVVVANDATVKGGTYYRLTVKKHLRAQEIAFENRLPCLYLVDSGGAFLPLQADVFPDREHFGRIFYNQARMSAAGIPQVAVVL